MLLRKILAFLRRDYLIESSYKLAFALQMLMTVFPVFTFYFVAKLITAKNSPELARYGGEYFPFVVIGIALTQYFYWALRTFTGSVRRAQMTGVLEAILSTRTGPATVVLLSCLYSFLATTVHVLVVFGIGAFLGMDLSKANIGSALVVLLLTVAAFAGIGIAAGAVLLTFKKSDPIDWVLGSVSGLLGGAFFPVEVLPAWLRVISQCLPITYSMDALRLSVLEGYSVASLAFPIGVLLTMSCVLVPLGLWMFSWAVERGRRDGTLLHY